MRIDGWEDWRFYWPGRYRDVFRQPDSVFVGEPLDLPATTAGVAAVWLEPPADMGKPVWRDVLEWVQLGPDERAAYRAAGARARRTLRLWGRIAAKEAARRLWPRTRAAARSTRPTWTIEPDPTGRPGSARGSSPDGPTCPAVVDRRTPRGSPSPSPRSTPRRLGIDVEPIVGVDGLEATAPTASGLLGRSGPAAPSGRAALVRRRRRQGDRLGSSTADGEVVAPTGRAVVRLGGAAVVRPLRRHRDARGDYVWAWTPVRKDRTMNDRIRRAEILADLGGHPRATSTAANTRADRRARPGSSPTSAWPRSTRSCSARRSKRTTAARSRSAT